MRLRPKNHRRRYQLRRRAVGPVRSLVKRTSSPKSAQPPTGQQLANAHALEKLRVFLETLHGVKLGDRPIKSLQSLVSEVRALRTPELKVAMYYYLAPQMSKMTMPNGSPKTLRKGVIPEYVKAWIKDAREIADSLAHNSVRKIERVTYRECPGVNVQLYDHSYGQDDAYLRITAGNGRKQCVPMQEVVTRVRKSTPFNKVEDWGGGTRYFPRRLLVPTAKYAQESGNPFLILQTRAQRWNQTKWPSHLARSKSYAASVSLPSAEAAQIARAAREAHERRVQEMRKRALGLVQKNHNR